MDDQKKKQFIIVGALGAVLAGVLFYQFVLAGEPTPGSAPDDGGNKSVAADKTTPKKGKTKNDAAVNLLEATEIDIDELTQSVEVQPIDYSAVKIGRNPMAALVGGPVQYDPEGEVNGHTPLPPSRPREVTGIIWDDVNPVAIIDNMVVPEGYKFADGVVVQVIEQTRVLLLNGDKLVPLEMKEF